MTTISQTEAIAEMRDVIRIFLATLCLDTEEDAVEVANLLDIEDPSCIWELAQKANKVLDDTEPDLLV